MAETHKELKISRAEAIIRYKFNNKDHIWEALQPRGSGINRIGTRITTAGNREVAIVGDAIMATVLSGQWLEANHPSGQSKCLILPTMTCVRPSAVSLQTLTCVQPSTMVPGAGDNPIQCEPCPCRFRPQDRPGTQLREPDAHSQREGGRCGRGHLWSCLS